MKNGKFVFNATNGKRGTLPPKKDAGKAKAPKPSAEQKRTVESFAGEWKLEGTITTPDGKTVKAPTTISAAKTALGKGISGLMSGSAEGMGPFEAGILVGFDPLDKTLHFMAVTTDDEVHDHRCKWKDDKTAVCEPLHAGMNGEPITEDLSFKFDKGSMAFNSVVTMKDGGKMVFEGKGAK